MNTDKDSFTISPKSCLNIEDAGTGTRIFKCTLADETVYRAWSGQYIPFAKVAEMQRAHASQ
jgi:hypothetical protein